MESPRINASMRPSGESAGWVTESGSLVSCTHCERSGARVGLRHPQGNADGDCHNGAHHCNATDRPPHATPGEPFVRRVCRGDSLVYWN